MTTQMFGNIELSDTLVRQKGARMLKIASLQKVDGVEVVYTHYPMLIGLTALSFLAVLGVQSLPNGDATSVMLGGLGVVFFIAYFLTRHSVLAIRAGHVSLVQKVTGASFEKAMAFAEQVRNQQEALGQLR